MQLQQPRYCSRTSCSHFIATIAPFILPSHNKTTRVVENELAMYEQEPPIKAEENPLAWWERASGRYPNIAKLAKKYLAVPGTSVRAERVFSDAGNIVNKKRAALSSDNVDKLVFLSNNL